MRRALGNDQKEVPLLVLQEQVFGVAARNVLLDLGRLFYGEYSFMLIGFRLNSEFIQADSTVLAGLQPSDFRNVSGSSVTALEWQFRIFNSLAEQFEAGEIILLQFVLGCFIERLRSVFAFHAGVAQG